MRNKKVAAMVLGLCLMWTGVASGGILLTGVRAEEDGAVTEWNEAQVSVEAAVGKKTHSAEETVTDSLEEYAESRWAALEKFAGFQLGGDDTDESSEKTAPILSWDTTKLLPDRWYAGDYGQKPTVKSQGRYGTCWALTATSALEAALLPEEHLVFSADHMALNNAFTVDLDDGGDYLMIMAYLSGWQGPVLESEDPYGDGVSPDGLQSAVHVQEIQVLENASVSEIKRAVYDYGAVQTSLYLSHATTKIGRGYYQQETSAYYYPEKEVQNHDILILGWDDSFSRFKFAQVPEMDGAFICQNTWGDDFGEEGIFYVSYADANIGVTGLVFDRIESADNYDRIYQTDDCGWQGRQGYSSETCWMANVYTAQANESLAAVGFYGTGEQTSYEIYLVKWFQDEASFDERIFLQSGTLQRAGYYTIDLEQPVSFSAGEPFAVVVKITTPGSENPVAVEYKVDEYTQNVTTEGKDGYLSQDGTRWEHTESRFGTNVCLKAYTRDWSNM